MRLLLEEKHLKRKTTVKILVLDDDQKRHEAFKFHLFRHDITHVYTCDEAIKAIEQEKWDIIFLDHDLEDRHYSSASDGKVEELEKTGYDVAVHIAKNLPTEKAPQFILIHSWNPVGWKRMFAALMDRRDFKTRRWMFNPEENPLRLLGFVG